MVCKALHKTCRQPSVLSEVWANVSHVTVITILLFYVMPKLEFVVNEENISFNITSLKGKIRNMPVVPVLDRLLTQLCVQFLHLCALHTAKICTVKIICETCAAWNLWCAACSVTHCVNLQKTSAVLVYEGSGRAGSGASVSDLLFVLLSQHFQKETGQRYKSGEAMFTKAAVNVKAQPLQSNSLWFCACWCDVYPVQ